MFHVMRFAVRSIVRHVGPANVDTVLIAARAAKRGGQLVYPRGQRLEKQELLDGSVERVFRDGDYVHRIA